MKYDPISSDLFVKNRRKFMTKMKPGTAAIFNSNDLYQTSADSLLNFHQQSDLLYLSGLDQEETIIVLFPDSFQKEYREIAFVTYPNPHLELWEGHKFTKQEAREISGLEHIYWLSDFPNILKIILGQATGVYFNTNEHLRRIESVQTRDQRFFNSFCKEYPLHHLERSAPIMHEIRSVKEKEEIELIQKACNITEKGFRSTLAMVKNGVPEYEVEAAFLYEFIKNRSKGFAYRPIVASGINNCTLHYLENNRLCKNGDLLLLDVGAEYANYKSDMTRTIPVSGKFSKRQADVYKSVLTVKKYAETILKPGIYLHEYHKKVNLCMQEELLILGLITSAEVKKATEEKPAYKKYFMHGTSHFLGLDVHDVGHWTRPIQESMVFTIEPGIYIPEENFGIRLEDDYMVSKEGNPVNLMKNIPIEIEEIEEIMAAQ